VPPNGIFVSGAAHEDENEEIGLKLAELIEWIGELVSAYRKAIDDGVITRRVAKPDENSYQVMVKWRTFLT
jgi:hypothetical protein